MSLSTCFMMCLNLSKRQTKIHIGVLLSHVHPCIWIFISQLYKVLDYRHLAIDLIYYRMFWDSQHKIKIYHQHEELETSSQLTNNLANGTLYLTHYGAHNINVYFRHKVHMLHIENLYIQCYNK